MPEYKVRYENKDEVRQMMAQLLAQLPEQGSLQIQVKEDVGQTGSSLDSPWEEMGSQTGVLIGRFIGATSDIVALGLQSLFLGASSSLDAGIGCVNTGDSNQEHGVPRAQPLEP